MDVPFIEVNSYVYEETKQARANIKKYVELKSQ